MTIQKYRIDNIFKLILVFGIIISTTNLVWASDEASNTPPESSGKNKEETEAIENSSAQQELKDTKTNSDDGEDAKASEAEQQFKGNNAENVASKEFLNPKNILLLFAIIDLPIIALFLTLWFLNRKEQKQKLDHLANNQNTIDRKLKQLEITTLKPEQLEKFKSKIVKEIEENKQEIINSRIELLAAMMQKQSERVVNSNGNADIYSSNSHNFPTFAKEQTEHQSDIPSHNPVAVIEQIPQFVDRYNLDKKSLSNEAIATVAATEASLNERRLGKSDILTLEPTSQKKYWIVQEDDHYLVPHAKINIDEYNKTTLESLFECINFDSDYRDFHLIEPAKVSQLDSELWQLEKKGKLEFS